MAGQKRGRTKPAESALPVDKRYYRIGEVSEIAGVKPYVLRYWESEFRWMVPQKSRSKQRLYRRRDIDTILLIKKLQSIGMGNALAAGDLSFERDQRARFRKLRDELTAIRAML